MVRMLRIESSQRVNGLESFGLLYDFVGADGLRVLVTGARAW